MAGGVLGAPLAAEAQSAEKVWRISVLSFTNLRGEAKLEAFRQGLRDRDYVEGQNLAIEYRSSEGKDELLPGPGWRACSVAGQCHRDIRDQADLRRNAG